jgi:hypothetical protein
MCRHLSTALTYPVFGRLVPRVGSCPASARAPRRLVPHQQHAHHHKDEVIVSTTEATIAIVFVVATP